MCLVFAYSLEANGQTTSKGDIRFFYTKNQPRKLQIDYVSEFYFGQQSIQTIDKDMLVNDIFLLIYDAQTPLAVTDNGKLLGVVIRGSVLEALAETEVNEHE